MPYGASSAFLPPRDAAPRERPAMQPLFPDKNNLVVISRDDEPRKRYRINANCEYLSPRIEATGNRNVDGDYYKVPTDAGQMAVVWVANDPSIDENLKYFCHGHAFGTYKKFGYSLAEVNARALDEWDLVGPTVPVVRTGTSVDMPVPKDLVEKLRDARARRHGVVAVGFAAPSFLDHLAVSWNIGSPRWAPPKTVHSFRVREVAGSGQGFLDSVVSAKNTFGHFEKHTTVRAQLQAYEVIVSMSFLRSKKAKEARETD